MIKKSAERCSSDWWTYGEKKYEQIMYKNNREIER
jgi:hypothetical protein|tara:strand:- start:898 stop:1002 length:105 start_codon:yes stop_codon:yes gene_type:complete